MEKTNLPLEKFLDIAANSDNLSSFNKLLASNPEVVDQVTSQNDTVLHVAANFKRQKIATRILDSNSSLLFKKNSQGDTPLHIAARAGSSKLVKHMINQTSSPEQRYGGVEGGEERLERMRNLENETALHGAVRHGHLEVVKLLLQKDKELGELKNGEEETPLFVAAEKMRWDIACYVLNAVPNCAFQRGSKNMNALHAAIVSGFYQGSPQRSEPVYIRLIFLDWKSLKVCLLLLLALITAQTMFQSYISVPMQLLPFGCVIVFCLIRYVVVFYKRKGPLEDFILKLMKNNDSAQLIEGADEFGWTPLHYAAYLNQPANIVRALLEKNRSATYIPSKGRETPFQIAARKGHLHVLEVILKVHPDIWEWQEESTGSSILHIAAKYGNADVVDFILDKAPQGGDIINRKNREGATPLHVAVSGGLLDFESKLFKHKRVDKAAVDKHGYYVKETVVGSDHGSISTKKKFVLRKLEDEINRDIAVNEVVNKEEAAAKSSTTSANHEESKNEHEQKSSLRYLEAIANNTGVVATLIATVSFAAAFQIPGGYDDHGIPILFDEPAFKVFVIANTIAFSASVASINVLLWASIRRSNLREIVKATSSSILMTRIAILGMVIAFISGTCAILSEYSTKLGTYAFVQNKEFSVAAIVIASLFILIP